MLAFYLYLYIIETVLQWTVKPPSYVMPARVLRVNRWDEMRRAVLNDCAIWLRRLSSLSEGGKVLSYVAVSENWARCWKIRLFRGYAERPYFLLKWLERDEITVVSWTRREGEGCKNSSRLFTCWMKVTSRQPGRLWLWKCHFLFFSAEATNLAQQHSRPLSLSLVHLPTSYGIW